MVAGIFHFCNFRFISYVLMNEKLLTGAIDPVSLETHVALTHVAGRQVDTGRVMVTVMAKSAKVRS